MHIVGVIPARYGSQRLPAKPLIDLLGKPMIQRVYEQARKARLLHEVVVATDDERIAKVVEGFGGEVAMTSPEIPSGSDRLAAVAQDRRGDMFVNIQGDEPLMNPVMIDQGIQTLLDSPEAHIGTLVKKIESVDDLLNANVVKAVFDSSMFALYFSRAVIPYVREHSNPNSWLMQHTYYKHIGLYVFRRDSLLKFSMLPESPLERTEKLEQLRALDAGMKIKIAMTEHDSIPVDTKADAEKVIAVLKEFSVSI